MALVLCANAAQADDGLFYFGAGVTSNHVKSGGGQWFESYFPDINSTSWQVFAGVRPLRLFAVEADYVVLGSHTNEFKTPNPCADILSCAVNWNADAKAFAGYAVGFLPLRLSYLDVYGKAGVAHYTLHRTITEYNSIGRPISSAAYPDDGTVFTWGAGMQAHVGMIGGRLEYEGFNKAASSVYSFSVFVSLK